MLEVIRIEPAPARRQEFAAWAVAQDPKVRTCSATEFAVPADLYAAMPEDILIGSRVDGHRYVSPEQDAAFVEPAPAPTPETAQTDVSRGTGAEEADAPSGPEETLESGGNVFICPSCPRTFTTPRGRDTHARIVHHPEG